jgi:hypothetical protein
VLGRKRRKFSQHVVEIVEKGALQRILAKTGSIILDLGRVCGEMAGRSCQFPLARHARLQRLSWKNAAAIALSSA